MGPVRTCIEVEMPNGEKHTLSLKEARELHQEIGNAIAPFTESPWYTIQVGDGPVELWVRTPMGYTRAEYPLGWYP